MGGEMKSSTAPETKNPYVDLAALSHPLILLSIALLLINDHILKVYYPSWVTGKLSDVAGLFFFPILLSAILNIICGPLNLSSRHVAMMAFGFTGIWFGLIKTHPLFGDLTETFLSGLLSMPTQIICDPTDLIALGMLLPAWQLRTIAEKQENAKIGKLSYFTLCAASIATLATSPAAPPPEVRQLIAYENTIYTSFYYDGVFYSKDGGHTWVKTDFALPPQVTSKLDQFPELPVTLCLPDDPSVCYRTGQESIMVSLDAGRTWSISWNIPQGRRRYMELYSYQLDLGPYDLAVLELDGRHVIVAAMGTEGVLVKTDDAAWQSYSVGYAGPMPAFGASGFSAAMDAVSTELNWIAFISILLLFLNMLANVKSRNHRGFGILKTVAITVIISIMLTISSIATPFAETMLFIGVMFSLVCAVATVSLLFQQLLTNTTRRGVAGLGILMMIWLTSCGLFISWAFGIIPVYETALNGVALLYAAYLPWLLYQLVANIFKRGKQPAEIQPGPESSPDRYSTRPPCHRRDDM
jgi:hypothetical protein